MEKQNVINALNSALKRNEILTHATEWMNLENIIPCKISRHTRTNEL